MLNAVREMDADYFSQKYAGLLAVVEGVPYHIMGANYVKAGNNAEVREQIEKLRSEMNLEGQSREGQLVSSTKIQLLANEIDSLENGWKRECTVATVNLKTGKAENLPDSHFHDLSALNADLGMVKVPVSSSIMSWTYIKKNPGDRGFKLPVQSARYTASNEAWKDLMSPKYMTLPEALEALVRDYSEEEGSFKEHRGGMIGLRKHMAIQCANKTFSVWDMRLDAELARGKITEKTSKVLLAERHKDILKETGLL
jgi:hypothetical protein